MPADTERLILCCPIFPQTTSSFSVNGLSNKPGGDRYHLQMPVNLQFSTTPHYSGRQSEYDVANQINVTVPSEVRDYVNQLYSQTYQSTRFVQKINQVFDDFARLYEGRYHGFLACDTLYHDMQHSLDVTLAMARLLSGYEQHHPRQQLGDVRFVLGIVISLFHDAGYIRRSNDQHAENGAIYTLTHVSRSGDFLKAYLSKVGLGNYTQLAALLVHFTGYEFDLDDIETEHPKDRTLGYLLGTADLIAQMSDRCYLEKCRDRLYPEFVLCGLAGGQTNRSSALFRSPTDLLNKTPDFFRYSVLKRLNHHFDGAFEYASVHFGGPNHYMGFITRNIHHLEILNQQQNHSRLQRQLPETRGQDDFPFTTVAT